MLMKVLKMHLEIRTEDRVRLAMAIGRLESRGDIMPIRGPERDGASDVHIAIGEGVNYFNDTVRESCGCPSWSIIVATIVSHDFHVGW
jgi:hypothetical protein